MPGYTGDVRALYLVVPEDVLAERHRRGADRHDEVWDGVLHMVPQPTPTHNLYQLALRDALGPIARRLGLEVFTEAALYVPRVDERNYRVPDLSFARVDQRTPRGLDGAELVIEVLSPDDESRAKLPFFARAGVREVWIVEPQARTVELYELADGSHVRVQPGGGVLRSRVLGVELRVIPGPLLEIRDAATAVTV